MVEKIAVLGAGTIGMSWAALFAVTGREVVVYDPAADAETRGRMLMETSTPALRALGWDNAGDSTRLRFTADPVDAVTGADFIQESVPERIDIKHDLYKKIEPALAPEAIIGTSTSGLKLTALQAGLSDPGHLIIAHPFNPPHIIPLVELMGNEQTAPNVLNRAETFYDSLGKVCVRLNKEVPGHIANRLQAALWREAIHLAMEGVASVEDIDKAVVFGPGLRWAALGPTMLFHLGGGPDGIRGFCDHLGGPVQSWWNNLGTPDLTPEVVEKLANGIDQTTLASENENFAQTRDNLILAYLAARRGLV